MIDTTQTLNVRQSPLRMLWLTVLGMGMVGVVWRGRLVRRAWVVLVLDLPRR